MIYKPVIDEWYGIMAGKLVFYSRLIGGELHGEVNTVSAHHTSSQGSIPSAGK